MTGVQTCALPIFKRIFNKINELLTYFEKFQSIGKKAANVFWEKYDSPYTFYDNSDYIEYCKNLDEIYVIEYIKFIKKDIDFIH